MESCTQLPSRHVSSSSANWNRGNMLLKSNIGINTFFSHLVLSSVMLKTPDFHKTERKKKYKMKKKFYIYKYICVYIHISLIVIHHGLALTSPIT